MKTVLHSVHVRQGVLVSIVSFILKKRMKTKLDVIVLGRWRRRRTLTEDGGDRHVGGVS